LNNVRRSNNNNFIELFNIFVKEFAFLNNTKKREISNSIIAKIKNFDNIIKENNNKQETRYKI
jgi:hypothetical protein